MSLLQGSTLVGGASLTPSVRPSSLILEGPLGSGKTGHLVAWVADALNSGALKTSQILVLCANHHRKQAFETRLLAQLRRSTGQLNVYTYAGWVRNVLFLMWPEVEKMLANSARPPSAQEEGSSEEASSLIALMPTLGGFEDSEYLMTLLLNTPERKLDANRATLFADFKGEPGALVRQLIRRVRLRSENRLSRAEMARRSHLIQERCQAGTYAMETAFDALSAKLRVLDMARQLDVFHHLLAAQGPTQRWLRQTLSALVVDDVDETIPAQQAFIHWLAPSLEAMALAADVSGGSRRGYLNAYPYDWMKLRALVKPPEADDGQKTRDDKALDDKAVQDLQLHRSDAMAMAAEALLKNWQALGQGDYPTQTVYSEAIQKVTAPTRIHQWDQTVHLIETLLHPRSEASSSTAHPRLSAGDIAIVTPRADLLTIYPLQHRLSQAGLPFQTISGTQRLSDDPVCLAFISALVIANKPRWPNLSLTPDGVSALCTWGLGWSVALSSVTQALTAWVLQPLFLASGRLPALDELPWPEESALKICVDEAKASYRRFQQWVEGSEDESSIAGGQMSSYASKAGSLSLNSQRFSLFHQVFVPLATETTRFVALKRLFDRFETRREIHQRLQTLGMIAAGEDFDHSWLLAASLGQGLIADNPEAPEAINAEAILIATPQKAVDLEARRKVYFWLDAGDVNWARTDTAPLYNAWIHSAFFKTAHSTSTESPQEPQWQDALAAQAPVGASSDKQSPWFDEALQTSLTHQRAGHLTRTLMLLATEKIWIVDSALDDTGRDLQPGPLLSALGKADAAPSTIHQEQLDSFFQSLRADQSPALAYSGGTMALTAVPGAGKTYVNVALVLKLISQGLASHPSQAASLDERPQGIPAERILMLTYMESAAKTMLRRIRQKLAEAGFSAQKTPCITTIHGLAFKILNDNEHALLLGLEPGQIQVIDDSERSRLLQMAASQTLPEGETNIDHWAKIAAKGINHAKSLGMTPAQLANMLEALPVGRETARLRQLLPTYMAFNQLMRDEGGWLDFTDLILGAIHILETYPTIRKHYQSQFDVILEDEAQDSSRLEQRFIRLLSCDERPNLIRTGDTNQSILTTFTAAEPEVFRRFIREAHRLIAMDHSGRCAPEIIQLANDWLYEAPKHAPELAEAFLPVTMAPVAGQNPALLYPVTCHAADTLDDEMQWLTRQVQACLEETPEAKIAVLTRRNQDADRIAHVLHQAGIQALSLSDVLPQQAVWGLMSAWLSVLNQPAALHHWQAWLTHACSLNVLNAAQLTHQERAQLQEAMAALGPRVALPSCAEIDLPPSLRAFWFQLRFDWLDDFRLAARNDACAVMMQAADRWLRASVSDQSNAYLAAQYLHAALKQQRDLHQAEPAAGALSRSLAWLQALSRHPSGKKSFLLEDAAQSAQVVAMSLHKSKGQEFDVVFLPMLTNRLFPSQASDVRLDEADRLILALDG
ncbi:MAG: ATP-dependent helicase, partial [Vampirovibrionales bacterium]|nr:ATP-dependent helicase [Vampirovibrionales bacterium]